MACFRRVNFSVFLCHEKTKKATEVAGVEVNRNNLAGETANPVIGVP
jgi:hypothetical protein